MTAAPTSVETAAALAKLSRVLEVDEDEIEFLGHLDVDRLRLLHWQILDTFQAANSARLQRVAGAAKLLPAGLVATLAERWFGSVLCAQLVGLVEPARAGQYARHMTPGFMADITARTDPRVAGALAHRLDLPVMQAIAVTLVERDDYLTLAGFVDHLPAEIIAAILEAIDDNATVVRIARYVEDPTVLDPVVALIPDDRILGLVTAVDDEDLWADGLHLFGQLGDTQITRIADALVAGDPGTIRAAFDGFERHDVWHHGIHLLVKIALAASTLDEPVRARLRVSVAALPEGQIAAFEAAAAHAGHPDLLERLLARD